MLRYTGLARILAALSGDPARSTIIRSNVVSASSMSAKKAPPSAPTPIT
jgi:hypothetical protein